MRAINLVPADQREGGLSGGRSGGLVYVALGGLFVLVIAVAVLTMAGKKQKEAEQTLASVEQTTATYTSAAAQYSTIQTAAADVQARITAVEGLADARFDWAGAMRDLSRVVPKTTQIQTMSASVRSAAPGQGTNSALRAGLDTPAITLAGCSVSQNTVADLLGQLQAMRRVTQVSLENSALNDAAVGENTQCTVAKSATYNFTIVVFYANGTSVLSSNAALGGDGAAATTPATEAAGGTTTPASSTTTGK